MTAFSSAVSGRRPTLKSSSSSSISSISSPSLSILLPGLVFNGSVLLAVLALTAHCPPISNSVDSGAAGVLPLTLDQASLLLSRDDETELFFVVLRVVDSGMMVGWAGVCVGSMLG